MAGPLLRQIVAICLIVLPLVLAGCIDQPIDKEDGSPARESPEKRPTDSPPEEDAAPMRQPPSDGEQKALAFNDCVYIGFYARLQYNLDRSPPPGWHEATGEPIAEISLLKCTRIGFGAIETGPIDFVFFAHNLFAQEGTCSQENDGAWFVESMWSSNQSVSEALGNRLGIVSGFTTVELESQGNALLEDIMLSLTHELSGVSINVKSDTSGGALRTDERVLAFNGMSGFATWHVEENGNEIPILTSWGTGTASVAPLTEATIYGDQMIGLVTHLEDASMEGRIEWYEDSTCTEA